MYFYIYISSLYFIGKISHIIIVDDFNLQLNFNGTLVNTTFLTLCIEISRLSQRVRFICSVFFLFRDLVKLNYSNKTHAHKFISEYVQNQTINNYNEKTTSHETPFLSRILLILSTTFTCLEDTGNRTYV